MIKTSDVPEQVKEDIVTLWREFDWTIERLGKASGLPEALARQYIHEYVRGREHARRAAATEAEEKRTRKRLKRYRDTVSEEGGAE